MRWKILAVGRDEVTTRINTTMIPRGIEVVRLFELPENLGVVKQEQYDVLVIDGCISDVANVCFRASWMCRLRTAVFSDDIAYDQQHLKELGVDHFINAMGTRDELASDLEMMVSLGAPEFEQPRILLIEDDRHIREAVRLSFRIFWPESELYFADEGQTGINILKNKHIDTILLDLGLPDMTGFEVLSYIRTFSRTPVIVVSAARDQNNVIRAINAGANDYLVKPFKQIELMPRIRKYVRQYARTK